MQTDEVRRTQLGENMRFYGDIRFKQLTLLMAVMTLVVAGVAQSPDKVLADRITLRTAAASFALLFTAVTWVMEVRAVLHWNALFANAQDLWPRPVGKGWEYLTTTNAVLLLHVCLYGFWLYCAWFWRLETLLWVVFALLGCTLFAFSLWAYLGKPPADHMPHVTPRGPEVQPPSVLAWNREGEPQVLAQEHGKKLLRQRFVDPSTSTKHDFALFGQKDWAVVLPLTSDQQVIAVWQYKQGCDQVVLELPAGTAEEENEPPELLAKRELREETGYEAGAMTALGPPQFISTRSSWTKFHMFLATECRKVNGPKTD